MHKRDVKYIDILNFAFAKFKSFMIIAPFRFVIVSYCFKILVIKIIHFDF